MSRKIKINKELPSAYNPAEYEDRIYEKWEKSGFFRPEADQPWADNLNREPYSIMMPPPNVTGVLHLGHALENSLMDIMARYQRMRGKKVLLLPGTDHAAMPTQAKVEKILIEQGIKNPRQELGREKLLEKIRQYAEESKSTILKQIRKMGVSCDWSRLAYTFDEPRNRAVNEAFVQMFIDGLIYRGKRIVNWDAKLQTTISDDEIVWQEEKAPFYYLKYGPFVIATARPETKFGDKYVVMHPNDDRYKKYKHGDRFDCEWINGKVSATVIKDEAIDPRFGTGVMTITPWHDMVDFDIAERHGLSGEQIIDFNGQLLPIAGEFAGLNILEARPKVVEKLKNKGLIAKVEENYLHRVAKGDRSQGAVEPQIKEQWFVAVNKKIPGKDKSLKNLMKEAVTTGHNGDKSQKVKITPERFEKIYLNWIDRLRDWCISRQIWWGHRMPVWYCGGRDKGKCLPECHRPIVSVKTPKQCPICGSKDLIQDEDTLDTWFSSGLWTFSALGWPSFAEAMEGKPACKNDLKTFHPTGWMQMGYEILFFWMARMILMSTYALDQIPFKDVYIHGMLRNESGKKFSKSSGNNIDPLEIITKYGTDALRLSLISGIAPGNDARFYEEKVAGARNLVNKLWNVARFIISNQEAGEKNLAIRNLKFGKLTLADKWILGKINDLINKVTEDLENYQFSPAGERLRIFTWDDLADWYLEISKLEKTDEKPKILWYILEELLKLWHPFAPFITEAIWQELGEKKLLMIEKWPAPAPVLAKATAGKPSFIGENRGFELIKNIVIAIRNARAENKIEPAQKIKAVIYAGAKKKLIESQVALIKGLRTGTSELKVSAGGQKVSGAIATAIGAIEIYLIAQVDKEKEAARLKKEIENLEKIMGVAESRLDNKEFISRAPAAVVKKEKIKLTGRQAELEKTRKQLKNL